jgi:hypothetical protein
VEGMAASAGGRRIDRSEYYLLGPQRHLEVWLVRQELSVEAVVRCAGGEEYLIATLSIDMLARVHIMGLSSVRVILFA